MNTSARHEDRLALDAQQTHWQKTFASRPEMFGTHPSYPAQKAAALFQRENKRTLLELGAGQGRDTLFFAGLGFDITALDYSNEGLEALCHTARDHGLSDPITSCATTFGSRCPFPMTPSTPASPTCCIAWR
jgi:cyclopropane fatty-acyl-phospholipid synthase-like methyltransferase